MRYDILNRPTLLAENDTVIFETVSRITGSPVTLDYTVQENYLRYNDCGRIANSSVFRHLGMDAPQKESMADSAYGYDHMGGDWPTSAACDYNGLTNLVNTLFRHIADGSSVFDGTNPTFDSAARVPYERMVTEGFKMTLNTVKTADHKVTPLDVASVLSRNNIQGFELSDISDVLYKLSEIGILTYLQEADGTESYFVDPERKAFLDYIHAQRNGIPMMVIPREHELVSPVLRYIRDAPASVTFETLLSVFGRDAELQTVLGNLQDRRILKHWENGYYTRRECRDEVTQILAEC